MALYRQIHTSFWEDEKIVDDFTPEDKYFMLYLMTNPHTNLCGCYSITIKQMEFETGYNKDTIQKLLERFQDVLKMIQYDTNTKELFICNWHKYNWTNSPKMLNGLKKEIKNIKSETLKSCINRVLIRYGNGIDTVSLAIEKEIVLEKEKVNIPTKKEIENYLQLVGRKINIDDFMAYYEANDWLEKSGLPINWKQKVISWSMKEKSDNKLDYSGFNFSGTNL